MSWISRANQDALVRVIGQRLKPGGLAYVSYNVATGWASMLPVRALMRLLANVSSDRSDEAVMGVLDYLDILKDAGPGYFVANPTVVPRIAEMRQNDARYLAHEYLNADWQPLMFAEAAELMRGAKCTYIGSASLAENLDQTSVPRAMQSLLGEVTDPILKETLRDFGMAQRFRRDIYRRGVLPARSRAVADKIDAIELIWSGPVAEDPVKLTTPLGQVTGLPEIYQPLVAMLVSGPRTFGFVRQADGFAQRPASDVLQAVVLLIASGYVSPMMPPGLREAARAGTGRLNAAIGDFNAEGGQIPRLVSSVTGLDVVADVMETLVVRERLAGRPMEIEGLTDRVLAALNRSGRSVVRDGKPVMDIAAARVVAREAVGRILSERIPAWERLGVLGVTR
jgi:hypothetical protein